MEVINIHQREYNQPSTVISEILETLSSSFDRLWPVEKWPPMVLNNGLKINSFGGHGPIGYYISNYAFGKSIEFTFTKPTEFIGTHKFEIIETAANTTLLRHTINMNLNTKGIVAWYFVIKWLHDALLEDCLNKVHNQINISQIQTPHNFWVKYLRNRLKEKRK
jgi:hypothetical protein